MNLTKEALLADKQAMTQQIIAIQGVVSYIEQLVAFMDRTDEGELDMKKDTKKGSKGKPTKGGKSC